MDAMWKSLIRERTGAVDAVRGESIQSLWSGFGEIFRVQLFPATFGSLIVKHISPQLHSAHPRGWGTDRSTRRKLRSYEIETNWYTDWQSRIPDQSALRIPRCIGTTEQGGERWILLEDLDAAGFDQRRERLDVDTARICLRWLANFHGTFLDQSPDGLWPIGTYWHLATRPDEFAAMQAGPLKQIASTLDAMLNECRFQTIVHGDAKVANFCFSRANNQVAALDFQYVGGGCGMKDVAYFLGSCFDESECERLVPSLLDDYFTTLRIAVAEKDVNVESLESEWRDLFAPAWTDFHRFLAGWVPSHPKIHRYTEQMTTETIRRLSS